MDTRQKIVQLIQQKTGFDNVHSKDMEIGVYNWTLQQCQQLRIAKNWKNPRFTRLYLEKSRSVISNLDPQSYLKNINLCNRIKENEFYPHELPFMNPENVHPTVWGPSVERLMKKYENAYEQREEAMTEMFTCAKCKKNKCSFYEKQIRSGDEGMTLFIRCVNCGHKWRQN